MKRRTFTITIEYADSLFPDDGVLLVDAVFNALHSRHAWFGPDQPGVMTVHLAEGSEQ